MTTFSLKRLVLTNFRAVNGEVAIDFDTEPGLYFVAGVNEVEPRMGANGASKSTCFVDAFLWLCYGVTSRQNRPGTDVENWSSEDSVGVVCEFTLDDAIHQIERWRKPSKLLLDGVQVEQDAINDLLPLGVAAIRRSFVIDQFSRLFLSLRPEEKSGIFTDTLHLDMWLTAAKLAGDMQTEAEREITQSELKLAGFTSSIFEVRDQLEMARKKSTEFETERETKLTVLRQDLKSLEAASRNAAGKLDKARERLAKVGKTDLKVLSNDKRTEERRLVAAAATAEANCTSALRERDTINRQLAAYRDTSICPECGQKVSADHINKKRDELQQKHDELNQRMLGFNEAVGAATEKLASLRKEIEALDRDLMEFDAAQTEVSLCAERSITASRALNEQRQRVSDEEQRQNAFAPQIGQLESRLASLDESKLAEHTTLSDLNREVEIYRFWRKGYLEIRLELIDGTLAELQLSANRHAQTLGLTGWEIQFSTERETQKGAVSHSFSVFLFPPGQDEPISWEAYSGGESQRWQMAVTFALAEILLSRAGVDTDIEILDEPTAHLSPEGIEDLLICLKERAIESNRRIYLIDHHSLDRGAFDGIWTVKKTVTGVELSNGH